MIDVTDSFNPYIFSKTVFPNENAASVCYTPDFKNLYSIGNTGLRRLPLDVDLTIHT